MMKKIMWMKRNHSRDFKKDKIRYKCSDIKKLKIKITDMENITNRKMKTI
jgi:membrane-bound inhibitor of C-type lysozyme